VLDAETLRPLATNGGITIKEALAETDVAWFGDTK
jgi:hypothetical protein